MPGSLFVDLYELTMMQAYHRENLADVAVFELFFRTLPPRHNYLLTAGLDLLLDTLEQLRFQPEQLAFLAAQPQFSSDFIERLRHMRFTGDVYAIAEGTVVFPQLPLLQVVAPLAEAQWIETLALCQLHFPTLAATKGARNVTAAGGRRVVDFGSRRAHGRDAALAVARGAYLAGAAGTALVEAGQRYGIPIVGTMAHSYIEAHDDELAAFAAFCRLYQDATLLVDTYDTLGGVAKVIQLCRQHAGPPPVDAIRLDSGDLPQLARQARRMLDEAGLASIQIVASGGLDEYQLQQMVADDVPINGFGVGTSMAVSEDAPSLDMVYKLVHYGGKMRMKLSSEKATYPGPKQVFRQQQEGQFAGDTLAPAGSTYPGQPLLTAVMRGGRRLESARPSLEQIRQHAAQQLRSLPPALRSLDTAQHPYDVAIAPELERHRQQLQSELQATNAPK